MTHDLDTLADRHPLRGVDLDIAEGETQLRPVTEEDVGALFGRIHGRDEVLRWLCWQGPDDLDRLRTRYLPPLFGAPGSTFGAMLAVVDVASGEPVGETSLTFEGSLAVCELGYWLGTDAHGRGHGRRLVTLAVELAFGRARAQTVTASVKDGNSRSLRVLERAGFVLTRAPGATADAPRPDGIGWIGTLTARAHRRRNETRSPGL